MSNENTLIANHLNTRVMEKRDVASLFMLNLIKNPEALVDFSVKNWKATDSIVMTNSTRQMLLAAAVEQTKIAPMNTEQVESHISEPAAATRRSNGKLLKDAAAISLAGSLLMGGFGALNKCGPIQPGTGTGSSYIDPNESRLAFDLEVTGCIGFALLAGVLRFIIADSYLEGIDEDKRAELNAIRTQLPDANVIKVLDEQLDKLEPLLQAELRKPIMQAELRKMSPAAEAGAVTAR